jgi:hypothetical protein
MVKTYEIGYLGRGCAALGEIANPRFREIVSSRCRNIDCCRCRSLSIGVYPAGRDTR